MSVSSAEQNLKQAGRNLEHAQKRHTDAASKQANLENEIGRINERAAKATSDGMRRSYENQLRMKQGQLERARNDLTNRLADMNKASTKVTAAEAKLREEVKREEERDRRQREQRARQDKMKRDQEERRQRAAEQAEENAKRREEMARDLREAERDNEIGVLSTRTTELERRLAEESRQAAPAEVGVLLLASNPDGLSILRIDRETREIERRVRAAEYRDSIFFRSRLARRLTDLVDDLNDEDPVILHFSGHGNAAELAFEDESGQTVGLDNQRLGRLLEVAGAHVRLVVFNSCDSAAQANIAVQHVEVAVGMNTAIDDEDAKVFAGQFYSSIAAGRSVAEAFDQAKFQLEVDGSGEGANVPRLFAKEGVDPKTRVLVNPDPVESNASS
jgi:hypothetical protein